MSTSTNIAYTSWMPNWGIDLLLSVDATSVLLLTTSLLIIISSLIVSTTEEKSKKHYFLMMLLTISFIGFCTSSNLVLKVLFWETCFIPILLLMLSEDETKGTAQLFSLVWLISGITIIVGSLLYYSNLSTGSYGNYKEIIFWLFMSSIFIRSLIYPFDRLTDNTAKNNSRGLSIIVTLILPLMSLLFLIQVVVPSFKDELVKHNSIIYFALIVTALIRIAITIRSKKLYTVINSQVIIFNTIFFFYITNISQSTEAYTIELISIKSLLNVVIVYYGIEAVKNGIKTNSLYFWILLTSLILSFGLISPIISKPMMAITTHINADSAMYGTYLLLIVGITLLVTSIKTSYIIDVRKVADNNTSNHFTTATMIVLIMISVIAPLTNICSRFYEYIK